jgi:2-polyprenyl-3-methyl-5-hydroxy-6-metoxy-1,4-benzoquinol methylase
MSEKPQTDHVAHNVAIYSMQGIAPYYAREPLFAPEIQIFIKHKSEFADKTVLDIGVGTGRTSKYLAPYSKRYVGIELNKNMLDLFSEHLPQIELVQCDMREFYKLNKDKFDFVLGPYSAFDALNHNDRVKMFHDIHAMMQPNGMFVFATHNLNWAGVGSTPQLEHAKDPVRLLKNYLAHRKCVKNHRRMKPLEERYANFAILNDISHEWLALLYYITREEQTKQLRETGFEVLEVYDRNGVLLGQGMDDTHCAVLYYVCRRVIL